MIPATISGVIEDVLLVMFVAFRYSSTTPMVCASAVSLTKVINSLPIGGKIRFTTWGIIMRV